MTALMQHSHQQSYPPQPSMLRMYPSSSTQQPAAQCLLRSPADAIHILESVRLGLIPRVTRRLTGHERAMIRPGTVWVWEEEETNMRRWTDGRRWGASRVGGGGFLVYREVEGGSGGRHDSPSASPPPSSRNSPTESSPRPGANGVRKAGLVKQTYSTSMAHPVTGRVKKFHVVAYSCKSDPGHHALPLPHQLPHLAYVKIMPGVWPDWEQRQDENGGQKSKSAASQPQLVVPVQPAPARSPSASSYSGGPVRPSGPPSNGNGHSPGSRSGTPQYGSYYANGVGPAPGPGTPPSSEKDRYHPYRSNRPAGFPSSLAPSSAPYGSHPPPGMYDRGSRSPGHPQSSAPPPAPYEHHWPPMGSHSRSTYPDEASNGSASRAPPPPGGARAFWDREHAGVDNVERDRDPSDAPPSSERPAFFYAQRALIERERLEREFSERERERERDRDPIVSVRSPSPRAEAPIRSSYSAPFAHPSISAARDSHSRPGSPSLPPPDRNRIGIAGIMNGSSGITLPPLRLALDGNGKDNSGRGGPSSPGDSNESEGAAAGGRKWGEDQRQLNQLGRMVGL